MKNFVIESSENRVMKQMEAKVKVVSETAEISIEDAKLALELADDNIERALELVPYVEKSIVIVHGRFVCGKNTKLYGIFRLVGHGRDGFLLDFGLAMSYNFNDIQVPISSTPEAYKKMIEQIFRQTETNQVHTFLAGFYEHIGVAQIYQIYSFTKNNQHKELLEFLRDLVGAIWGGSERVEVEVETFLMTKLQCDKKGLITYTGEEEISEETNAANLTIYLDTEPMISPVKGKTIDKFAPNELIPVRIIDQREAGKYLGKVLSNPIGIAVGQLKDVYLNEVTDRYTVTVEFGPKINGRFVIEPSVRLANYTDIEKQVKPEIDEKADTNSIVVNPSMMNNFILMIAGMFLIIIIFIILTR